MIFFFSSIVFHHSSFKGSIPGPVMDDPPRKMTGKLVRLSTISEQEPDKLDTDPSSHDAPGGGEWGGSSFSMCSDKFKNSSSRFSSDESYQPGSGGIV